MKELEKDSGIDIILGTSDRMSVLDHIEKAFGGKDMDEIIVSHKNISMVRDNLKKIESSDNSINAYMVALNHYL